jgi:hypothetical protein
MYTFLKNPKSSRIPSKICRKIKSLKSNAIISVYRKSKNLFQSKSSNISLTSVNSVEIQNLLYDFGNRSTQNELGNCYWWIWQKYNTHVTVKDHIYEYTLTNTDNELYCYNVTLMSFTVISPSIGHGSAKLNMTSFHMQIEAA